MDELEILAKMRDKAYIDYIVARLEVFDKAEEDGQIAENMRDYWKHQNGGN